MNPMTPKENIPVYHTITGNRLPLSDLNETEYRFLQQVAQRYNSKQDWTRFAAWWNAEFTAAGLSMSSVVYRVCQDLEARLGINQGKVSRPDYRDYLVERIDAEFASRQEFCQAANVDPGQLSRVLANRADLSMKVLQKVLDLLHAQLVIQTNEESRSQTSVERAAEAIAVALSQLRSDGDGSKVAAKRVAVKSSWLDDLNGNRQNWRQVQEMVRQAGTTWGEETEAA